MIPLAAYGLGVMVRMLGQMVPVERSHLLTNISSAAFVYVGSPESPLPFQFNDCVEPRPDRLLEFAEVCRDLRPTRSSLPAIIPRLEGFNWIPYFWYD